VPEGLLTYLLTSLLTAWNTGFLQNPIGSQLVKKLPAFYGTWTFITAFKSARHLSLSWASSIQTIPPHPTYWRSILILSSHLRLGLPYARVLWGKYTLIWKVQTTLAILLPACTCKANINLYTEALLYIGNTTTFQKNILRPTTKTRAESMLNCRHTISTKQAKSIGLTVAAFGSSLNALWHRSALLVGPLLAASFFSSRL